MSDLFKKFSTPINYNEPTIGDTSSDFSPKRRLTNFLQLLQFDSCRIVVIVTDRKRNTMVKEIEQFARKSSHEFVTISGKELSRKKIKGTDEVIEDERGNLVTIRVLPTYINNQKQIIYIENFPNEIDIDTYRMFVYMAHRTDDEYEIKERLPIGSKYLFIVDSLETVSKLNSISDYVKCILFDERDFKKRVFEYLNFYKSNIMRIEENGFYKGKEYGHILPLGMLNMNILDLIRDDFFSSAYCKFLLHPEFSHLNSSQAMCINFFFPLINTRKLEAFTQQLYIVDELDKINYENVAFEFESRIEPNNRRKTNFDLYIPTKLGKHIYVEVKYTEYAFGKVSNDEIYGEKYDNVYKELVMNCPAINKENNTKEFFLENYQIMRNLVHIDDDSFIVIIYPENNKSIREKALSIRNCIIVPEYMNHVLLFTWKEMIKLVKNDIDFDLSQYYEEFMTKYFIQ